MQRRIACEQKRGARRRWIFHNSLIIKAFLFFPKLARLWLEGRVIVSTSGSTPSKRLLIVDDDPSIRYMLSRILYDEGYEALSAANGREGLKTAVAYEVDLVLLDLKMPGLNGQETLQELALLRPGLPVIVMTAYPGQKGEAPLTGFSALLQKPLDFPMLLEAIRKLLAQAAAST
jgi:two-component system response regulator (stage 0 sporulation protein F)